MKKKKEKKCEDCWAAEYEDEYDVPAIHGAKGIPVGGESVLEKRARGIIEYDNEKDRLAIVDSLRKSHEERRTSAFERIASALEKMQPIVERLAMSWAKKPVGDAPAKPTGDTSEGETFS